jgi:hypothetical protein
MKYLRSVLILIALSFNLAHAGDSPLLEGTIDDLARTIATYFPKSEGTIVSIDQGTVRIKIDSPHGLAPGVLLSAYREGEPFYHPVTGVRLGQFEEEVALLELIAPVPEAAKIVSPKMPLLPTDKVRLTATKISVGVTTEPSDLNRLLTHELISALTETGRFAPIFLPPGTLPAVAGPLYLIVFSAKTGASANPIVSARMQNVKTGSPIFEMEFALGMHTESGFVVESLQQLLFEKYQKR